jgi:TIR domain
LRAIGFNVWLDDWKIRVGDSFVAVIEKGISDSTWMIVILSPTALKSKWVLKELRAGLVRETDKGTMFVLPVLYKKTELPPFLQEKFYANFTNSYEDGLQLIRDRLVGDYMKQKVDDAWFLIKNPLGDNPTAVFDISYLSGLPKLRLYHSDKRASLVGLRSFLLGEQTGATAHSAGAPDEEPRTAEMNLEPEVWFGESGRLVLWRHEDIIHGNYDWHGLSLVGRIEGQEKEGVISFEWSWSVSSEKGRGVLWTDIHDVLHGGWWMDFSQVNEASVLAKSVSVPYPWQFVRLRRLKIENAPI